MRGSGNGAVGQRRKPGRVVVPGKSKATVRISLEADAKEAEVNDGSVPEAGPRDNMIPVTAARCSLKH